MSIFKRVKQDLVERRDRILSGNVNCIPWGLPRFESESPGIEKGKYYIITANSKVGKSQACDWFFMYHPYRLIKQQNLPIKLKIIYFSLEMSAEEKVRQLISNSLFLNSNFNTVRSPKVLRSTREALSEEILRDIDSQEDYITDFLEHVTFVDNVRNPYGIYNYMKKYAEENGTVHKKKVMYDGKENEVFDYYTPNDPEEYVIPIVDHASLLTPENNGSIKQAINMLSSKYFVLLRNYYNFSPVLIQQQSSAQESIENMKAGRLRPTMDGLGEDKTTQRDANVILGLFSPFRHAIPEYNGYDIKFFKDNIRFLEILGGREGGAGTVAPLYFNGAVNYFMELPKSDDHEKLQKVKQKIIQLRKNEQE